MKDALKGMFIGTIPVAVLTTGLVIGHELDRERIQKSLSANLDYLVVDGNVLSFAHKAPSAIPGLLEVRLTTGEWLYVTRNGQYFLRGDLFEIRDGHAINLSE